MQAITLNEPHKVSHVEHKQERPEAEPWGSLQPNKAGVNLDALE